MQKREVKQEKTDVKCGNLHMHNYKRSNVQISAKKENLKTDYKLSKKINVHDFQIGFLPAIIHIKK